MATLKDMEIGALINLSENHNKQTKNVEEKESMSQIVGKTGHLKKIVYFSAHEYE